MPRFSFTFENGATLEVLAPGYIGAVRIAADMTDAKPARIGERMWDGMEWEDVGEYASLRQYLGTLEAV